MTDFEEQQNTAQKSALNTDKPLLSKQTTTPAINGVPVQALFEKVVLSDNRKKMQPDTFRRPTYLRYIEYS